MQQQQKKHLMKFTCKWKRKWKQNRNQKPNNDDLFIDEIGAHLINDQTKKNGLKK